MEGGDAELEPELWDRYWPPPPLPPPPLSSRPETATIHLQINLRSFINLFTFVMSTCLHITLIFRQFGVYDEVELKLK